jgi:hypothetical protein
MLTFALPMTFSVPLNFTPSSANANQPSTSESAQAAADTPSAEQPSDGSAASTASTSSSTPQGQAHPQELRFTFILQMPMPLAGGGGAIPIPAMMMGGEGGAAGNFSLNDFLNYTFQLQQQQRTGPPPASKSAVERLDEIKVTEAHIKTQALCSVCQDTFGKGDSALGLPCDHLYHRECITPWLTEHNTCPMCRYELPTDDAEYERGRIQRMQKRDEAKRQRERKCELGRMRNEDCVLLHHDHRDGEQDNDRDDELMAQLECGHTFHAECLDAWRNIAGADRCPSCRKYVSFPEPLSSRPINTHKRRVGEATNGEPTGTSSSSSGDAMEVEAPAQPLAVVGIKNDEGLTVAPASVADVLSSSQPDSKMEEDVALITAPEA